MSLIHPSSDSEVKSSSTSITFRNIVDGKSLRWSNDMVQLLSSAQAPYKCYSKININPSVPSRDVE